MAVNQTQGVVLAIFGASAGGHLSSLDANATANGLASLASDLSASAGLILGVDLSSNATFTSTVLDNLGVTAGDARTTAEAYFTSQLAAGASRGDVTAAAVEFLLGTPEAPFDTIATTFTATVTEAVTWSQGAGASTLAVSQLRAQQDNAGGDGSTFALTTAATDVISGTAGNDTFDGSVLNSVQTGDVIADTSTNDADVLNMQTTSTTQAPRLSNIETVNVTGEYVSAGLALTNVTGTNTLTLNTELAGGTGTVTASNSLNARTLSFGENIQTVNVTSLASGTRDNVAVVADSATTVNVTGNAGGADIYTVSVADDATLTLATLGANDNITINSAGGTLDLAGVAATEDLTINTDADLDINLTVGMAADTVVNATHDVTFDTTGALTTGLGSTKTGSGTYTLELDTLANGNDFKEHVADVVEISSATATSVGITVNEGSTVNFSADPTSSALVVVDIDNADGDLTTGALRLNLSESTTNAATTTGAKVDTVVLTATPDEASDTDPNTTVGSDGAQITLFELALNAATDVISVTGADDLTITTITNNNDEVLSASSMTGALTIGDIAEDLTVYGGSGNDSIKSTTDKAYIVYAGAGNDTIDMDATVATAGKFYGQAGDDKIYGGDAADTIEGGAGDDTIDGEGGADTITAGDGADTIIITSGEDGDTLKDLEKGIDKIVLVGAMGAVTGVDIDISDLGTITSNAYNLDGEDAFDIKLTGQSSGDMSDTVQFGEKDSATYDMTGLTASNSATVVAGDLTDYFKVDNLDKTTVSLTLGDGADVVVHVNDGTGYANSGSVTINDFVVGTDKIILTGTAAAATTLNVGNITPTSGVYAFEGSTDITLKNGGSNLTEDDLSGSVQLGMKGATFTTGNGSTITGSTFNDWIAVAATGNADTINFIDNNGNDTITGFVTTEDKLSFDGLTSITATAGTAVGASDKKVADASSGAVYVFATEANSVTGETIDFDGKYNDSDPDDDDVLADVAAFLEAGLNEADGEVYVAVINNTSNGGAGDLSYLYLVTGDDDGIGADDLTLLGTVAEAANGALVIGDIA